MPCSMLQQKSYTHGSTLPCNQPGTYGPIFKAYMKWHHCLHGAQCTVYTDHEPWKYIYVQPHLNAHQVPWLEQLAELDLNIVYKPGVENMAADVLSCYGCHV